MRVGTSRSTSTNTKTPGISTNQAISARAYAWRLCLCLSHQYEIGFSNQYHDGDEKNTKQKVYIQYLHVRMHQVCHLATVEQKCNVKAFGFCRENVKVTNKLPFYLIAFLTAHAGCSLCSSHLYYYKNNRMIRRQKRTQESVFSTAVVKAIAA